MSRLKKITTYLKRCRNLKGEDKVNVQNSRFPLWVKMTEEVNFNSKSNFNSKPNFNKDIWEIKFKVRKRFSEI